VNKKGLLFIVSAPSGAGKTTLCKELASSPAVGSLRHSVSHTTRGKRPGEMEGEHYYFVSEDKFAAIRDSGGFVEWAKVHGNLYGTSRAELERIFAGGGDVILDIDTQGAAKVRESGTGGVFIFILPPSMQELEKRLRSRNSDDEDEIRRRLARAVEEIKSFGMYDYIIVNDNMLKALDELAAVVKAERRKLQNVDPEWITKNFGV